jgi:hypothetical protein
MMVCRPMTIFGPDRCELRAEHFASSPGICLYDGTNVPGRTSASSSGIGVCGVFDVMPHRCRKEFVTGIRQATAVIHVALRHPRP